MAYVLRDDQKLPVAVAPVDAYGNPARIDGVPAWSVSDDVLLELQDIAVDGLSVTVVPKGPLGVAQVQVTADADLGAGFRAITGVLDIQIEAGEAVSLGIVPGTPIPK